MRVASDWPDKQLKLVFLLLFTDKQDTIITRNINYLFFYG